MVRDNKEKSYDYFKTEGVVFYGKFAGYANALWKQNVIQESMIQRLVDIYAISAIVGLRIGRRLENDMSNIDEKRAVQLEQIAPEYKRFMTIMQLILILDESRGLSEEERVKMAFEISPKDEVTYKANMELFNSYARGGLQYLYEELVIRPMDIDDDYTDRRIANIIALTKNPLVPERI